MTSQRSTSLEHGARAPEPPVAARFSSMIQERPDEAIFLGFVSGVAIGALFGSVIAGSNSSGRLSSRHVAEGLGQRLLEKLDSFVPSSVSRSLGLGD